MENKTVVVPIAPDIPPGHVAPPPPLFNIARASILENDDFVFACVWHRKTILKRGGQGPTHTTTHRTTTVLFSTDR